MVRAVPDDPPLVAGEPYLSTVRAYTVCSFAAVRNMIQAGIAESVAMKISGHRTQSMLTLYNIIAERDIKAAALKIQLHLANQSGGKLGEELGERTKAVARAL